MDTTIIPHFLLGPDLDHFAWIGLAVALAPAVFAGDVLVAIFEDEDGCFVDFDGVFGDVGGEEGGECG